MSAEPEREHGGPIGVAPDLGRIEEGLARRTSELVQAARRVRTGADAEAIHDLRVATRRLTAALRVWDGLVPARAGEAACRALRRLRRRLGEARELEVNVALVEARPQGVAAVEAILERLRERLARRRRAAMKRVSPRRLRRLLGRVEAATGAVRVHGDLRRAAGEAQGIERMAAGRATTALRWAAERPDDVALHEARIRVKQWRYVLECLEEALPGTRWQEGQPLRTLQTLLGDIHDRAMLRDLFAREALEPMAEEERAGLGERITALDEERRRAVRRFQRRATAEIGAGTAAEAAERDEAIEPAGAPDAAPAAPEAARPARTPGERSESRDQRWGRMASWLEKSGGES